MYRFTQGVRAGCDTLVNTLKTVVEAPSRGSDLFGPAPGGVFQWHPAKPTEGPYLYGSPLGRTKRDAHGGTYRQGEPPYMRSGAGKDAICWEIREREIMSDGKLRIKVRIGVDDTARPGAPYMLFHEKGIKYPTRGPNNGTGPKLFRKWLGPTIRREWVTFTGVIIGVTTGRL